MKPGDIEQQIEDIGAQLEAQGISPADFSRGGQPMADWKQVLGDPDAAEMLAEYADGPVATQLRQLRDDMQNNPREAAIALENDFKEPKPAPSAPAATPSAPGVSLV